MWQLSIRELVLLAGDSGRGGGTDFRRAGQWNLQLCLRTGTAPQDVSSLPMPDYFRPAVSKTFHGRDIFAPVAAALATGCQAAGSWEERFKTESVSLPLLPEEVNNGKLKARIIHIDRFGNCITNITPQNLTAKMIADGAYLTVNGTKIRSFRGFFSERGKTDGTLLHLGQRRLS